MDYRFELTMTDEDYIAFNQFHALQTPDGKRAIRNSRLLISIIFFLCIFLYVLLSGWTPFSIAYVTVMAAVGAYLILSIKKRMAKNIKRNILRMKKTGRLPYSPTCQMEFYQDRFVEITPTNRTEIQYAGLEQICVLEGSRILLFINRTQAYHISIPQIQAQADVKAFLTFLSLHCNNIAYY